MTHALLYNKAMIKNNRRTQKMNARPAARRKNIAARRAEELGFFLSSFAVFFTMIGLVVG